MTERKHNTRCARCGSCTVVCPVYRASGGREFYSGRGKKYLLEVMGEEAPSPIFEDIFSKCLLCGACEQACPRGVDITREVREARAGFNAFYGEHGYQKFLARKILEQPGLLSLVRTFGRSFAALLEKRLPKESGLRLKLALFNDSDIPDSFTDSPQQHALVDSHEQLLYYPGCSARYLYPEIASSTVQLCTALGMQLKIPDGLVCCGVAMDAAGDRGSAQELARKNIESLGSGDEKILVSCGSCFAHLSSYAELFDDQPDWQQRARRMQARLVEMTCLFDEVLNRHPEVIAPVAGARERRVFYHDPCHLRYGLKITREPRQVLTRFPSIRLLELEDGPQCCGQGGLFHLGAPELAATIRDDLAQKVLALSPDIITSTCSGCLMQWRIALAANGSQVPVLHLSEVVLRALNA